MMSLPSSHRPAHVLDFTRQPDAIRENFFQKPQAVQGRILQFPEIFSRLCSTKGRIYIRDDYPVMYRKIKALEAALPGSVLAISGQPGTGKTWSLYAFMAYRLAEEGTVILATSTTAWVISSDSVQHIGHVGLEGLQPDPDSSAWLFVDDDSQGTPFPFYHLGFFTIVATSPRPGGYRDALEQRGGIVWLAKKWEEEELMQCLKLHRLYPSWAAQKSLDDVRKAVQDSIWHWGSAPRDVGKDLFHSRKVVWRGVAGALESFDANKLLQFAQGIRSDIGEANHTISHQLISYYRAKGPESAELSEILDFDVGDIEIKSFPIYQATQKKLRVFEYQQALGLFRLCRCSSESHMLAGWSFESIAIAALRLGIPDQRPLPAAHPLGAASNVQWRIPHTALFAPHGIVSDSITPSMSTSWLPRETRCYPNDFSNVELSSNHLYVPEDGNNPFFDAFIVSIDDAARVILVSVLQMSIAEQHSGSAKGYKLLQKLKRHFLGLWQKAKPKVGRKRRRTDDDHDVTVKFEYFLVVPRRLELEWSSSGNNDLRWTLPRALPSGLEGDFFVQEIPIKDLITLDLVDEDESSYDYAGSNTDPNV